MGLEGRRCKEDTVGIQLPFMESFKGADVAGKFSVSHIKSDNDQRKSSEHYIEDQKQNKKKKERNLLSKRVNMEI